MSIKGVKITSGTVGANTLGSSDGVSAFIIQGVATDELALGTVKPIFNMNDVEALGLDEAYDTDNKVVAWYHLKEFYRMAGEGTKAYVMLVSQALAFSAIVEDANNEYGKLLLAESDGDIGLSSFIWNPADGYTPTYVDGLDNELSLAIDKGQLFADFAEDTYRPLIVVLEGRDYQGGAASAANLRERTSKNVGVVIGQDYDYADTLDVHCQKHAAVGTALGCFAIRKVNENIGEVGVINLTNANTGDFKTAGLSNHVKCSQQESDLSTLDTKGYIFGFKYANYDGVRWNDDHNCVEVIIDAESNMNEYSLSLVRTMNKAKRELRTALLPKVKSVQPVDSSTGKLKTTVIKYFEEIADNRLNALESSGEISGGKSYVDPDSNLRVPPKTLKMSFSITPYETIGEIQGVINLKTSI